MKRLPAVFGLGALVAVVGVFAAIALAGEAPPEPPANHVAVTICHATNSETNPYRIISPDASSVIQGGHGDHTGPIFEIGMKADKVKWGDVIPSFVWYELVNNQGDKSWVEHTFPGLNGGDTTKCITNVPDTFAAKTVCDIEDEEYDVSGTVNGEVAVVDPATFAGNTTGEKNVRVTLGDKSGDAKVTLDGKCTGDQPPPPPPHEVKGDASVSCVLPDGFYRVSGTVDGQAADKVVPATIPGNFAGSMEVTVARGDTSFRGTVTTDGKCGNVPTPPVVTPPAVVTPPPAETTPSTVPTAPFTPPKASTKPAAPAKVNKATTTPTKPTVKVAGAVASNPPKLAYTP